MSHRGTRSTTGIPALASLLALLIVPVLHGPLSHDGGECGGENHAAEACVAADETPRASSASPDACPLCLSVARTRSVLQPPGVLAAWAPQPALQGALAAAEAAFPSLRLLTVAAPRAPPIPV